MTVRRRLQALRRSPTLRVRTTPPAPGIRRLLERPSRGGGGGGGPDYLIEYSANPIVAAGPSDYEIFPPSAVDARWYTGPWHLDFTPDAPSSDSDLEYVFALNLDNTPSGFYYLRKNAADNWRFRFDGLNYNFTTVTYPAGTPLRFTFDPAAGEATLGVVGGASETLTIPDADFPTIDVYIGSDWAELRPLLGEIYQPIAGTP